VSPLLHLDAAAGSRVSPATLHAVEAHLRRELELGIYPAQAAVHDDLDTLRSDLAAVLGMETDGVAFVESATAALDALLNVWPLPAGTAVGLLPSEWGPNVDTLRARGLDPTGLPAGPDGLLDLEGLGRLLRSGVLGVVHLVQVPAHRGLRQPVAEAAALCRAAGTPLWVDVAQAAGQTAVACGADAVYGTGRKWLAGPRGVGFLAVERRHWATLRPPRTTRYAGEQPVRMLESGDAHVAGRLGLATAVRAYVAQGPAAAHDRLDRVGVLTREVLTDLPGWCVVPGTGPITALRPRDGADPVATRDRLLGEHDILVTVSMPWRAAEVTEPWLRVSPHPDVTEADLRRLAGALAAR
jgi:pyridoxal 5-phosphate dependent beta-lyase